MLLCFVFTACVGIVRSYGNGQVSSACGSMTPIHQTNSAQISAPPYTITADRSSFKAGEEIRVTLRATSGGFEGFMLQARKAGTADAIGSFSVLPAGSQGLTCDGMANSAVSHTSSSEKTVLETTWKAPTSGLSNIEFSATFVKSFATFWVGVKSSVITYNGTSTPVTVVPMVATANSECGKSKVCFSQPSNCDPTTSTNCYFMSLQTSSSQSEMKIEIVGPGNGYVAIGFSDDQSMGNDDIYICGKDTNDLLRVQHAFSTGKSSPTILSLGNVSDITTSVVNGVFNCSFTSRNQISTGSRTVSEYFLMIAAGASIQGSIRKHTNTFVSQSKANLLNPGLVTSGGKYPAIVKAHGALMLIAWMTTGSVGMFIARYLKAVGRGKACCGKDFWFLAHVTLMVLSIIATSIAFILVFSYARVWSGGAHPVLGCLVMILTLIQPVVAAFRCDPQHEKRFVFNWAHSFIALAIKGLAVAAIFTGLAMIRGSEEWMLSVMGGFVAWEALLYILQDLNKRSKKRDAEICSFGLMSTEVVLLGLFLLGNLAFLIALLVGIGKA